MKNLNKIILMLLLICTLPSFATTSTIVKAKLDGVKNNSLLINGKSYKYRIDEKNSVLAIEENEPTSIDKYSLKTGNSYYFELFSKKNNANKSEYNEVIYIVNKYSGGEDE